MKGLGSDATKRWTLLVDIALAAFSIEIDTPAVFTHHAQVSDDFGLIQIFAEIGPIGGVKIAASPTIFHTLPSRHFKGSPKISLSIVEYCWSVERSF